VGTKILAWTKYATKYSSETLMMEAAYSSGRVVNICYVYNRMCNRLLRISFHKAATFMIPTAGTSNLTTA
jgi:hypothetical protein